MLPPATAFNQKDKYLLEIHLTRSVSWSCGLTTEPQAFLTAIVVFSVRHKNYLKVIAPPDTFYCLNKTFGSV